jgi:sugar phosphate isomerase/epimerase
MDLLSAMDRQTIEGNINMYKNLSPSALGINGRQSEMIELALTHRAKGLEIDMQALQRQVESGGFEYASRFVTSAGIKVAPFEVPMRWNDDEIAFKTDLQTSKPLLETAQKLGCLGCTITVKPFSESQPYHENFEFHRERIAAVAEALKNYDLKLGLAFLAPAHHRQDKPQTFLCTADALLTLMKTTVSDNVGVVVDSWHWQIGGGTAAHLADLSAEQILEVRLADVPEDIDLETITEDQRRLPGTTAASLAADFLKVLSAKAYKGPVTPSAAPDQVSARKRDQIVRQAFEAVDNLILAATEPETETPACKDDDSRVTASVAN